MSTHIQSEHALDSEKKQGYLNDEKIEGGHQGSVTQYVNDVDAQQGTELSFGAILRGTAATPMTRFEKKAALINLELDKMGMGRYQWCIWFLCGFGYFLDLAWAQGVGLMVTAMYQEFNITDTKRQGDIFAAANAGLAVGALFWGLAVDMIGRKWSFNLTCLITSVFGLLLAAPKYNYAAICGIYFLSSLGLGGNIPIDATIALEFLPQRRRNLVALLALWQPIGVVVASAVAYGTIPRYRCDITLPSCAAVADGEACCRPEDNMGWRYLVIILGGLTLVVFFLRFAVFTFHESPKFLIGKGREAEAIEVLQKIAHFNKTAPPTLALEHFHEIDETTSDHVNAPAVKNNKQVFKNAANSLKHLKGLFTNKLQLFIFFLLAITYMGDYWSFNLAGAFLPIILYNNNVSSGATTVDATYQQYIIIYAPGIIGAVLALISVQLPLFGRKWSLVFSAFCQGLSMAMYTQVKTTAGYVGLNALEYVMQTYFNAVLYASAPELFDTVYRGSASGMLSCLGRIAGIVAPFAGAQYLSGGTGVLWLGAGGIWLAAITMIFLPVEMRNRQMF